MYQNNFNGYNQLPQYQSNNPYAPNYNQNQGIQQQNVQPSQIIRVNGLEGAKAYDMQPNSDIALFDMNEDKFYVKVSDAGKFSTIKTYAYTEIENIDKMQNQNEYALKKEVEELKMLIEELKNSIKKEVPILDSTSI